MLALEISALLAFLFGIATVGYVIRNVKYASWDAKRVERASFKEKQVTIGSSRLNYAEGPVNGRPLLLIHGQMTDWRSWSRVLPALSTRFHVFAVDCYGHGRSEHAVEKYSANSLVADLALFLRDVVRTPAIVAGHSSGGLVAAGLAAHAPRLVTGAVLEDPPFFSSVLPRAKKTFNYVDLSTTAHGFLTSGEEDFVAYYVRNAAIWELFGGATEWVRSRALRYRETHPNEPLRLAFMPPSLNEAFRAMPSYDPNFGVAFHDNHFHEGFEHAEVLRRISQPTALIHANWRYDDEGILLAAMDADDAARARSLLVDVRFYRVDAGHGFHFERPVQFNGIVIELEARLARSSFASSR